MEYVKDIDYEYIKNKYHDSTKPFNPFQRFIRHDEIFATETGLNGDEIIKKILEEDNRTVLFVTHDIDEALYLGDVAFILGDRPLKIKNIFKEIKDTDKEKISEYI